MSEPTLEYRAPSALESRPAWLSIAKFCAIVLAGAGTAIFILCLLTNSQLMAGLGFLFIIFVGLPGLAIGYGFVIAYAWRERRIRGKLHVDRRMRTTSLMLIANVPLAVAYSAVGMYMLTSYRIVIVNHSTSDLTNLQLVGGGIQESLPLIRPGETKRVRAKPKGDGELRLTGRRGQSSIDTVVRGYVTSGDSGSFRVDVYDDSVSVTGR